MELITVAEGRFQKDADTIGQMLYTRIAKSRQTVVIKGSRAHRELLATA
jgi:hypothetical protein